MMPLLVRWVLGLVAVSMIVLGAVSICMGFGPEFPDAHPSGAVFFVGGWLLLALEQIAWHLRKQGQAP